MIPRTLICELKSHIENLRKIHEEDLKAGFGSVKQAIIRVKIWIHS